MLCDKIQFRHFILMHPNSKILLQNKNYPKKTLNLISIFLILKLTKAGAFLTEQNILSQSDKKTVYDIKYYRRSDPKNITDPTGSGIATLLKTTSISSIDINNRNQQKHCSKSSSKFYF